MGLKLNPGVSYAYVRNQKGEITNVQMNEQGEPIVESSWDQFSKDPIHPEAKSSLIASVHKKRVYLSNFGTRLIDHKGILSLVTLQVKSEFQAKGKNPNLVVSPPRELRTASERQEFFANPRDTVVKVPDESGGVGVHILPTETEQNVEAVVASVKKLADFMGVVAPKPKDPDSFGLRAFDGRTFIFMGPDGKAKSDNWAILVRVADDAKLSTNTSQGAQYGWMQVHTDKPSVNFKPNRNSLPLTVASVLTASQKFHLKDYLISIDMTLDNHLARANPQQRKTFLNNFWNSARTLMSVLGPDYAGLIETIEKAQRNEIDDLKFKTYVAAFKSKLSRDGSLTMPVLEEIAAFKARSN
ncbi:MAG: hypothetical protein EOP05_08585 [Proteobacteria bacterium]|nr:MAG: hypothetical protein EOP05_08585 [Pseudomonadota bacterium]